jgi:hypothetical protein
VYIERAPICSVDGEENDWLYAGCEVTRPPPEMAIFFPHTIGVFDYEDLAPAFSGLIAE